MSQERILYRSREAWYALPNLIRFILTLGLYYFSWRAYELVITEKRIILRNNFLGRKERIVPINRVQDITIEQGILDNMFGIGSIYIETSSGPYAEVFMHRIHRPDRARDAIYSLMD